MFFLLTSEARFLRPRQRGAAPSACFHVRAALVECDGQTRQAMEQRDSGRVSALSPPPGKRSPLLLSAWVLFLDGPLSFFPPFYPHAHGVGKFPGPGSNPSHGCDNDRFLKARPPLMAFCSLLIPGVDTNEKIQDQMNVQAVQVLGRGFSLLTPGAKDRSWAASGGPRKP